MIFSKSVVVGVARSPISWKTSAAPKMLGLMLVAPKTSTLYDRESSLERDIIPRAIMWTPWIRLKQTFFLRSYLLLKLLSAITRVTGSTNASSFRWWRAIQLVLDEYLSVQLDPPALYVRTRRSHRGEAKIESSIVPRSRGTLSHHDDDRPALKSQTQGLQ